MCIRDRGSSGRDTHEFLQQLTQLTLELASLVVPIRENMPSYLAAKSRHNTLPKGMAKQELKNEMTLAIAEYDARRVAIVAKLKELVKAFGPDVTLDAPSMGAS